ncbi:cyclin-like protein interacting with PHO85 [Amphichorda felina]
MAAHPHDASPYRPATRPRQSSNARPNRSASAASQSAPSTTEQDADAVADVPQRRPSDPSRGLGSASRIPSPPPSSSPAATSQPSASDNGQSASMAAEMISAPADPTYTPASSAPSSTSHRLQQPSPASDDFSIPSSVATPSSTPRQTVIHVRDIGHVRSLAQTDMLVSAGPDVLNGAPLQHMKYDISAMPIGDIIEMVAALLTKITSTNDLQHDAMQRNAAHQQQANQSSDASGSQMSPMSHSVLAFHGKNIPAITILSYLSRIQKYCPTTFEVFLSLLVYFDRMTERVNDLVTKSEEARKAGASSQCRADVAMKDGGSAEGSDESDSDLADDDDDEMEDSGRMGRETVMTIPEDESVINGPSTYFVVDSFNIHRLIIAGVTCSSKFFSDVFYTNSRYAKVGGLPLAELNHLELQFLVLNDFRLAIPVEDLEAYATMLVEFYAREVVVRT